MITIKQQVFVAACPDFFPSVAFEMACQLAKAYRKDICFLGIRMNKGQDMTAYQPAFDSWIKEKSGACPDVSLRSHVMQSDEDFTDLIEQTEASMLIFQLNQGTAPFNKPRKLLEVCRQLRVPYFFVKDDQKISFDRILVPVGFLVEEREKGPFSASFCRYFSSEILIMPAHDYGSRARNNTDAIETLIKKVPGKMQEFEAKKDSFGVELEAASLAPAYNVSLLMISASREYGMDDIIFGPKELKVIKRATVPVMVINPRGDLYALCG